MTTIKIAYDPPLDKATKSLIKQNITPSMSSSDNSSHQYVIGYTLSALKTKRLNDKMYTKSDINVLQELVDNGFHYIEF